MHLKHGCPFPTFLKACTDLLKELNTAKRLKLAPLVAFIVSISMPSGGLLLPPGPIGMEHLPN